MAQTLRNGIPQSLELFLLLKDVIMSGNTDQVKGRVKEAAGAITGNDKLKNDGKVDQAAGKTKEAVENVVDKTKKAIKGKD